jgi:hypothetical protein
VLPQAGQVDSDSEARARARAFRMMAQSPQWTCRQPEFNFGLTVTVASDPQDIRIHIASFLACIHEIPLRYLRLLVNTLAWYLKCAGRRPEFESQLEQYQS